MQGPTTKTLVTPTHTFTIHSPSPSPPPPPHRNTTTPALLHIQISPTSSQIKYPTLNIQLRVPTVWETNRGEVPRQLLDVLAQANAKKDHRGKILVEGVSRVNLYGRVGGIRWFLSPVREQQGEGSGYVLGGMQTTQLQHIALIKLQQFGNYQQYRKYFQLPVSQYNTTTTTTNFLLGHYHNNHKSVPLITTLYLINKSSSQPSSPPPQQIHLPPIAPDSPQMPVSSSLTSSSSLSLSLSSSLSLQCCSLLAQKWEGIMDLQVQLKELVERLGFREMPVGGNLGFLSHFFVRFLLSGVWVGILVFNIQTLLIHAIFHYLHGEPYRQETGDMGLFLTNQYLELSAINRMKYPLDYYLALGDMCRTIFKHTMQSQTSESPNIQLQDQHLIQLAKYNLIHNQSLSSFPSFPSLPVQPILQYNPCSPTLLLYWLVSPPGSHKSTTLLTLKQLFLDYQIVVLEFTSFQLFSEQLREFMGGQGLLFKRDRFVVGVVRFWFSVDRMFGVVNNLGQLVPVTIYYQLFLVSSDPSQTKYFTRNLTTSSTHPNPASIQTSYHFSLEYLVNCLLTIQSRPFSPTKPQSRGTSSLSQFLHYISSTYSNLNLQHQAQSCKIYGGQINILSYRTSGSIRIQWQGQGEGGEGGEGGEIQDMLGILLERSYKKVIPGEDALLAYFLVGVEELEVKMGVDQGWAEGIAAWILEQTFGGFGFEH